MYRPSFLLQDERKSCNHLRKEAFIETEEKDFPLPVLVVGSCNRYREMQRMHAELVLKEFPDALDAMGGKLVLLMRGLAATPSPRRPGYTSYTMAKALYGDVFTQSHGKDCRAFYMWKGDPANEYVPTEISIWLETEALSLTGNMLFRIEAKDPKMMRYVLTWLFGKFPPMYRSDTKGEQQKQVGHMTLFSPYLG